MDTLLLQFGSIALDWRNILLSFMLAFLLSSVVAAIYERTFQGLSWSRGLLQSMVLGSLISCLLMIAIGDNIARGIGIVGSLAIIRFRTNLRDPKDLVFLFASLGVGVACGVQSYTAAIIGTLFFSAVAMILHRSSFATHKRNDGLIRFQIPSGDEHLDEVTDVLRRLSQHFVLVTLRDISQGEWMDCAYQIKLGGENDETRLIQALSKVKGLRGLTYHNQKTTVEV